MKGEDFEDAKLMLMNVIKQLVEFPSPEELYVITRPPLFSVVQC